MVSRLSSRARPRHAGPLRYLNLSLGTRCPQPPREAGRLLAPVPSPPVLASHISGRLAASIVAFRGRIGFAFAAARTVRLAGPRRSSYLLTPPVRLHVSQAFHMVGSFHPTRVARFILLLQSRRERRFVLRGSATLGEIILFGLGRPRLPESRRSAPSRLRVRPKVEFARDHRSRRPSQCSPPGDPSQKRFP
jgi:hypothetical protein